MIALLAWLKGRFALPEQKIGPEEQDGEDDALPLAFSQLWERFEVWLGSWLPWAVAMVTGLVLGLGSALAGTGLSLEVFWQQLLGGGLAYRFQLLFTLWLCSLIACLITALVLIAIPWALKQLQSQSVKSS